MLYSYFYLFFFCILFFIYYFIYLFFFFFFFFFFFEKKKALVFAWRNCHQKRQSFLISCARLWLYHYFYRVGGGVFQSTPPPPPRTHPFDLKFHFHGKFWINLINLRYCIYLPKIITPLLFILSSILLPIKVCKIAVWVANSVDPDQTPRCAASDLGLHCLLRSVLPNT